MRHLILFVLVIAACSGSQVGPVRFVNQPTVWRVDDRRDVAKTPATRPYRRMSLHFDSHYIRLIRGLNLTRNRRALGVNAFDDVPDSTWFTNRITARDVTAAEIERGPGQTTPQAHMPWTIKSTKIGGRSLGLTVEDARGVKFLLKFDRDQKPETETANDVIMTRLMWTAGYNVPADHVVYFRRSDLKIAPDAYAKKLNGEKQPLDDAFVDSLLAKVTVDADGRIRGVASIFIAGKTLGGAPRLGVRGDDPNDRIPHELRRDLRGLAPLFTWLSHTDLREDQSVDTWQEDPANKAVHYVVHYLIDFGYAFDAALDNQQHIGYEYDIDFEQVIASIMSLGLYSRGGEDRDAPPIRGIGLYTAKGYDPSLWKPNSPSYFPVLWADRFDQFWGSKLLIRFTRAQITAAVAAGHLTDPRAAPYLVETIIERQRMTARYWFARVSPVDEFHFDRDRLCFTDLALRHRLVTARTRFTVKAFDASGRDIETPSIAADADADGRVCLVPVLARGAERYTILSIQSSRGLSPTLVHLAVDPATGAPRVIGIHRQ